MVPVHRKSEIVNLGRVKAPINGDRKRHCIDLYYAVCEACGRRFHGAFTLAEIYNF
jgi:hypothetical protein